MSVTYSSTALDNRLLGTVSAIDAGGTNGHLKLYAGASLVCSFELSHPCGTVANGVLTFGGDLIDTAAVGNPHAVDNASIFDSDGNLVIAGLSVGQSSQGPDIALSTPIINAGQVVQILSARIIGA